MWRKDLLLAYLYDCFNKNISAIIDLHLEGPCLTSNGLYRLLDNFCEKTGYPKKSITIKTANMLEQHDQYNISRQPTYWYEVREIQKWIAGKKLITTNTPEKHFASFVGRSSWNRLWMSAILNYNYADKTLMSFHSHIHSNYIVKNNDGIVDYLGLEDLVKYNCDMLPQIIDFLNKCPRILDDEIKTIRSTIIKQNEFYPIQHPANLNILPYYNSIFVDIINETQITGNCFFVTEKTWRCIVARRPFIVMGGVNFLNNLKRLGFKTFNKWWSEEYDMYGLHHRIEKIAKLINQIALLSHNDLVTMLNDMQDILDHNYRTFVDLTTEQISEVFDV